MAVDSPEGRRRVEQIERLIERINARDTAALSAFAKPDVEVRVREGVVHGAHHIERFIESQLERFDEFRVTTEEFHEVDDGTIVVCVEVVRRTPDGEEAMRAWPAEVIRFDGDLISYFEGYPRQEDALVAYGIKRAAPPDRHRKRPGGAIDVECLRRTFAGRIEAVAGIDLAIDEGEIYAFLGPNGAGKTTTVRMLTTLLRPTSGSAHVAGFDIVKQAHQVRRAIGVALQEAALDPLMTGYELMELQATLHGIPVHAGRRKARELLERVDLTAAADRRVGTYSGGMRRRLDLAMALVHEPRVLFLDEPTTGLDPPSRRAIWDEVRALNGEGTTVFLTTQYLEEADQLADRVGIIDKGRMAAEGTPASLKAKLGRSYLELSLATGDGAVPERVLAGFGEVMPGANGVVRVALAGGSADIAPIVRALDDAHITVESLGFVEPTLDDVFLATTGGHLEGQGEPGGLDEAAERA